jgi:hypothetical protein
MSAELLRLRSSIFAKELLLTAATVRLDLIADGAFLKNGMSGNRLHIGRSFSLEDSRFEGPIEMSYSTIGGALSFRDAQLREFVLEDSNISGGLYFDRVRQDNSRFSLLTSRVGGALNLNGSTIDGDFALERIAIGGHLLLKDATFSQSPSVIFSKIDGSIVLSGANLPGFDLTNTHATELFLRTTGGAPPTWADNAIFVLRNARTGNVEDLSDDLSSIDAWPGHKGHRGALDLQGFTYEQLSVSASKAPTPNGSDWYQDWLQRDPATTRQPYQQLASFLRSVGDTDRADDVLYALRERERERNWTRGEYLDWAGLSLLKFTIGYGLGNGYFGAFAWAGAFTAIGMIVLWFSPDVRARGSLWCALASFDHLLPIVELNKEFGDYVHDPQRQRLNDFQIAYFSVHALVGYVLASFIVAGLAGLTQAR